MLKDQLKVELKKWEHAFIKEHGRDPNKDDIKRLPEIRNMYKKYASLRKDHSTAASHFVQEQPSAAKASVMELGPTPQIYGKAMSIFDMNISPIKTSLTGGSEEPVVENHTSDVLATSENMAVKRQLTFNDSSLNASPKKEPDQGHKAYGPNSPLKWGENLQISIKCVSPLKRTPVKGFNQGAMSFSPSPLVKRPLTRSLLELVREHEAIVEEFKQMEDRDDDETLLSSKTPDNIFAEEDETVLDDERKTVKTRRRRILRRRALEEEDEVSQKNIAQEIMKLKRQQVKEFLGDESSTEDNDDSATKLDEEQVQSEETIKKPTPKGGKKRNKKYNLVSNNFRRLKLPTKKAGNRRWGNRRR